MDRFLRKLGFKPTGGNYSLALAAQSSSVSPNIISTTSTATEKINA